MLSRVAAGMRAPEGAERVNRAQRAIHPGTKRLVDWRVVELRWIERDGDE